MKDSGNNLQFHYLYRDAGNYKQFGQIILSNPNGLTPEEATMQLKKGLIDGEFFYAEEVHVPPIRFDEYDPELDHQWHEFEKFTRTDHPVTSPVSVEIFLKRFRKN